MKFTINKKNYKLKQSINNITIQNAINIVNFGNEIGDDEFEKLIKTDKLTLTEKETKYVRQVICELSNLPFNIAEKSEPSDLLTLFDYVRPTLAIIYFQNFETYKPLGLSELKFKGTKYYMPKTININGETIIGYDEHSKNVVEASNLIQVISDMAEKGIELLPVLTAIYLREDGKYKYNEKEITERAEIFKGLPLAVGYDCFFFTYYYLINYLTLSRISLANQKVAKKLKSLIPGF